MQLTGQDSASEMLHHLVESGCLIEVELGVPMGLAITDEALFTIEEFSGTKLSKESTISLEEKFNRELNK